MAKENLILELTNISKMYPGVVALSDVSLEIKQGEVHALIGENGAGKSTLVKCCSGAIKPNSGTIKIDGEEFTSLTPELSEKKGVSVIYQEFNLVNELTVAENVFLGRAIRKNGIFLDNQAMFDETKRIFKELNIDINPNELVKNLTVGYQQMVEIAKSLSLNSKILFMDEPSASLTKTEVEDLFQVVETLKKSGVTIIYISHRLEEIFKICDKITVLRDGKSIQTLNVKNTDQRHLIELMVGREFTETFPPKPDCITDEIIFDVQNLSGNGVKDISFHLKRGEILGFGGLMGAGRTEMAELLFGVKKHTSGTIYLNNKEVKTKSPESVINQGIVYVSEDRKQKGALLDISIRENIAISILKRISRFSIVNDKEEDKIAKKYMEQLSIKAPTMKQKLKNLSGGNQQKVILGKCLSTLPDLIILDEPTRGIDVGAKFEIYKLIIEMVEQGKGVIMISSEMEELMGLSDRILVLSSGELTGELMKEDFSQEKILEYASLNLGEKK
jgi:ribose transport system ATP-binding protein